MDIPEPKLCWLSPDSRYLLVELTNPHYLIDEGLRMQNCLAPQCRSFRDHPELSSHWTLIKDGQIRLFSFRTQMRSVATICIHVKYKPALVSEIRHARNHPVRGDERHLLPMMTALNALDDEFPGLVLLSMATQIPFMKPPASILPLLRCSQRHHRFAAELRARITSQGMPVALVVK